MAKRSRKMDIEKKIKDGSGAGTGIEYKPWLTIQDVPSTGRRTRFKGIKIITFKIENVDNIVKGKILEFGWEGECGVIRNINNIAVGFYTINIDEPIITLQEIEIIDEYQNQGYGTSFINELFNNIPPQLKLREWLWNPLLNFTLI